MTLIFFILGLMIGAVLGILVMSLVQMARTDDDIEPAKWPKQPETPRNSDVDFWTDQ
jgi:hypothetical protein